MKSRMFDSYENISTLPPTNRHEFGFCDHEDEIIIGATAVHVFHLDFVLDEYDDFKIIYSQSLGKVLTKVKGEDGVRIKEGDECTDIVLTLTPEETRLFNAIRDTKAQLILMLASGDTIVGDINKVIVKSTLDELNEREEEEDYETN